MQKIVLTPIGYAHNANRLDTPSQELQASTSQIIVDERYEDGLMGIGQNEFLTIVFYFHLVDRYELRIHPRGDTSRPITGVFNTRSQFRPNPIGVTVVRLKSIEGNKLVVEGLDAVDGTPILDIKPHVLTFDEGVKADGTGKDRA
jgi:tRNA-Thr(GGU) m(6)t(6)A37 methyltransferase TsaA